MTSLSPSFTLIAVPQSSVSLNSHFEQPIVPLSVTDFGSSFLSSANALAATTAARAQPRNNAANILIASPLPCESSVSPSPPITSGGGQGMTISHVRGSRNRNKNAVSRFAGLAKRLTASKQTDEGKEPVGRPGDWAKAMGERLRRRRWARALGDWAKGES